MNGLNLPDQFLSRRGDVEPFHAMDVLARATELQSAGADVAFLCVGQPSASAPSSALNAAQEYLKTGVVSYTDAGGRADIKGRLARHYREHYRVDIAPERIFITTGSSAGFNLAFLACFEAGERVAIAAPGYPAYRNILKALSLEVVEIETSADSRWCVTPEQVQKAHDNGKLSGILIASPANPSGTMMTPQALNELIAKCTELGIRFISDEIYHDLIYPDQSGIEQATALQYSDETIVINSFSKFFCMTGWRVGWMVLPEKMVRPIERLGQSLYISAPELSQIAAMHALDGRDEMEQVRLGYAQNRALLMDRLPKLGFDNILPIDGAFYAYADASRHSNDTMQFSKRMLEEAKVAVTPGLDFDLERGGRFIRLSFAGKQEMIAEALDRLENWLR